MPLGIAARFAFQLDQAADALLQFAVADMPGQNPLTSNTSIMTAEQHRLVKGQDGIGERILLRGEGRIEVEYQCSLSPDRHMAPLEELGALPFHCLSSEAVQYLFDSRYCRSEQYQGLVAAEFNGTSGGARIAAIRDWIDHHFDYVPGASDPSTDATDSFITRAGICRDYTHVLLLLARASHIPARYVACYAPGVTPQDFHAVGQVFLADPMGDGSKGAWHLVDATGMADLSQAAIIGVGRDAADVSFLTTFAPMEFLYSSVDVNHLD